VPFFRHRVRASAHASAFKRTLAWKRVAEGRRIDLRHSAACLWLALSVDPGTVQAGWRTGQSPPRNLYLHHLGSGADRAGLNRRGHAVVRSRRPVE
jgi:hypothetical protein